MESRSGLCCVFRSLSTLFVQTRQRIFTENISMLKLNQFLTNSVTVNASNLHPFLKSLFI